MTRRRTVVAMALVSIVLSALVVGISAFERSMIPVHLHDHIESLGVESGTSGRVWSVQFDDHTELVDARLASRLAAGDTLVKPRWSWKVTVNGSGHLDLAPPAEVVQILFAALVAVWAVVGAWFVARMRDAGSGSALSRAVP